MQILSWAGPSHFSPAGTGLWDSSATGGFSICDLLLRTKPTNVSQSPVFAARVGRSSVCPYALGQDR